MEHKKASAAAVRQNHADKVEGVAKAEQERVSGGKRKPTFYVGLFLQLC